MAPIDLQTFTPPVPAHLAVIELKLPAGAHGPVAVESHGFRYRIVGDTLLGEKTLTDILQNAPNPSAAVADLYRTYQSRGYLLVAIRARVGADERVDISIVEGQITAIKAQHGVENFYRGVTFDPSISNNALIRRNIMAQAYAQRNGLSLSPTLKPAPQPGGSVLEANTPANPDFKPIEGMLTFGNYGSRYVSGMILGESLTVRPGAGTEFNLSYSHGLPNLQKDSAGSRSDAASVGGSVWTPMGLYGLSYARSTYRIGVAGAPLYPAGITQTWSLTGSQLLWASPTARLSLSQNLSHVDNRQTVFSGTYTLMDQNYNYVNFGPQYSRNVSLWGHNGVVNAAVSATLGLSAPRGTLNISSPGAPVSRFRYWQASLSWTQDLGHGWLGALNASGQKSLDTLPQNQQWVLGGYGSLSAWTPGILSGDGGYLIRAQLQMPSWELRGWRVGAQGFIEQGAVNTYYTPPGTAGWRMLADIGLGLTLTSPWKTTLSVQAARPIANKNITPLSFDSQRAVYVVLQQAF